MLPVHRLEGSAMPDAQNRADQLSILTGAGLEPVAPYDVPSACSAHNPTLFSRHGEHSM